jgi:hypothetical protein
VHFLLYQNYKKIATVWQRLTLPELPRRFKIARVKSVQTFSIILPNLIHKSKKKNLKH